MIKNLLELKSVAYLAVLILCSNAKALENQSRLPALPKIDLQELPLKLLKYQDDYSKKNAVITKQGVEELNITEGKSETPQMSLLSSIDRTYTAYGREALRALLENPLSDHQKLIDRQTLVQRLKNSPELLEEFDGTLKKIAKNQENLLLLWSLANPFNANNGQSLDILALFGQLTGAKNSKFGLEAVRAAVLGFTALATTGLVSGTLYTGYEALKKFFQSRDENRYENCYEDERPTHESSWKVWAKPLVFGGATALWAYKFVPSVINQEKVSKEIQELLISVRKTLDAAGELTISLKKVPAAENALRYAKHLEEFTLKTNKLSYDLESLLEELNTRTFKGKPSTASFMGRVRLVYQKMSQLKDSFIPLLKAIGEVDAFVSPAKLMREFESQGVHYCFTEFVKAEHPQIKVTKSWNPVIRSENLVTEDIALGTGEGLTPNVLLTGPHGGGKSTFMRQLAYSVLLSQVFGISPCESCTMTIFTSINTYLDIKDNMEEGMSTFMAERERITNIKRAIRALHDDKFGFTVIDELFKGTMEAEASRLIIKFMEKVEQVTESICIMPSHFIKPAVEAETRSTSRFVNYHMDTVERTLGRFKRNFKLVKDRCDWWFNDSAKRDRYVRWLQTVV